jgi:uncharacterized protein YoxC
MTVTEVCLIVIALSTFALAVVVATLVARMLPVARSLDALAGEGRALVQRLQGVTGEVEAMVRDARRTEERAAGFVRGVIDRIEPPLHQLASVIAGVGAAVSMLARLLPIGGRGEITRPPDPGA